MNKRVLFPVACVLAAVAIVVRATEETPTPPVKAQLKETKEQFVRDVKALPGGIKETGKAIVDLGKHAGHSVAEGAKESKENFKKVIRPSTSETKNKTPE